MPAILDNATQNKHKSQVHFNLRCMLYTCKHRTNVHNPLKSVNTTTLLYSSDNCADDYYVQHLQLWNSQQGLTIMPFLNHCRKRSTYIQRIHLAIPSMIVGQQLQTDLCWPTFWGMFVHTLTNQLHAVCRTCTCILCYTTHVLLVVSEHDAPVFIFWSC